ncbi:ChbG/HpnK family deacetylase [Sporomusa sp. KB1]|jgi:hopanoid biosynthesis associated protein HpnK|uniref:ChbG/HpnK family deacetylase n=1 Tax=Sporomusa sp. KB1 TaxID=943346 RepID=UPI00119D001F|nr:ChbG/HpnK family deacetylase [Sporomusa sp. KB1]TWH48329.1 hopanoid biosynthesis associated protein HpnK [Sporomusa sp. KB1]
MKQLIVNADDFGLHENINLGIIEGHTQGCITSTSIMAGGPAFNHAVALAADHPQLGIGAHLTLVGGMSVTDPGSIPSLVDSEGMLCASYPAFLKKFCLAGIRLDDVRRELTAQVKRIVSAGITITHLDSHQHMHVVPGILDIVLSIAKEFTIKAIRIPAESLVFLGGFKPGAGRIIGRSGLSILASLARFKARQAGLAAPDHFYGMLAGGSMEEKLLLTIIDNLSEGITEVMVHPGLDEVALNSVFNWQYHWQQELNAITSCRVAQRLEQENIKLVSFARMNNSKG